MNLSAQAQAGAEQAGVIQAALAVRQPLKQIVTRLMPCLFPQNTTAQAAKTSVLQSIMWVIQTVQLLQVVLQLLMQEEQHVMPMNAAGEAQHQALAPRQAVGAATQQATAAAQELCAHGMQQTHLAKLGHHQEQVQGIGDYRQLMK